MTQHKESAFETAIEHHLSKQCGYMVRSWEDFDRELCLDRGVFLKFLMASQSDTYKYLDNLHKENLPDVVISDLARALNSEHEGCLNVLRHGFKCYGKLIRAAYFAPASGMNPDTKRLYDSNILTITRQARYSTKSENSVDIVLCVNGIPVATLELKNPMTGQT